MWAADRPSNHIGLDSILFKCCILSAELFVDEFFFCGFFRRNSFCPCANRTSIWTTIFSYHFFIVRFLIIPMLYHLLLFRCLRQGRVTSSIRKIKSIYLIECKFVSRIIVRIKEMITASYSRVRNLSHPRVWSFERKETEKQITVTFTLITNWFDLNNIDEKRYFIKKDKKETFDERKSYRKYK